MKIKKLTYDPKAKVIIPVTPGTISEWGYSVYDSEKKRHQALNKAIRAEGSALSIYRHLIARATQLKNYPKPYRILRKDAAWIKKTYYGSKWWPYPKRKKYDPQIFYQTPQGKILDYIPKPIDYEFRSDVILRIVPEVDRLIEIAVCAPYDVFKEVADIVADWPDVERPSDKIIRRGRSNPATNIFIYYCGG